MAKTMGRIECWKMYWRMTELGSLTRRYIVIGAFDGALTIVAIVLGALAAVVFFGNIISPFDVRLLVNASVAAAIGLAISSGWGAYEAERVERKLEIHQLEIQMQRPMDGCLVNSAVRFATIWASFIHGFAPLPAAILPLIPLMILPANFLVAAAFSVSITMIFLFILGVWMGRIANSNMIVGGLRMVLAGVVTGLILVVLAAIY
ncbi:MAG: VIT1/CCC1 transporter family protein [Promethearchaeota archaeon]